MIAFTDTHTHIYTEEFDADRKEVIERALQAGVKHLLLPNIDRPSIRRMMDLCREYPGLCYPMMGLHPTELPDNPWPLLDEMEAMFSRPGHPFVAVGEVGIDLYWDESRREEQIEVFAHQAAWAERFGLPLMIHSRKAHRELVDTLLPFRNSLSGVFHCFGGTAEEARELLSRFPGFVLGIGGILTFKKSALPAVLAAEVPLHRIVIETDAPYLAPTPHRGCRNEPAYLPLVITKLAEVYERPPEEVAEVLQKTTERVFPRLKDR